MKQKLVCFVALILCLTLGVTAAMADGACGLGDAVVASWDGEAAPQVAGCIAWSWAASRIPSAWPAGLTI